MNHVTAISSHPGFRANGKTYDAPPAASKSEARTLMPLVPELPEDEAVEVGNGVTRYDFSIAFTRVCMRRGYPAIAIAAAMRLVEFLPRGSGECDPGGREAMVDELGRGKRRIDDAYQILETDGWIKRRRADGRIIITLMIPPDDADAHQFGAKIFDRSRAARVARNSKPTTRRKAGGYAQQNGGLRATQCCASKEQIQEEQRPKAAAVEIQSPVTEEATDTISAPYGADANPVERGKLDMPTPTISKAPGEPGCPADLETLAQEIAAIPGIQIPHLRPKVEHLNREDQIATIVRCSEIIQQRQEVAA